MASWRLASSRLSEGLLARGAGPVVVFLTGLALFVWTRGIWPDVLVDFGHEIFVFWRIAEGQVLFRDIAHLKGPFSPYFNGTVFRLFGSSFTTLVFTNLAVLALFAFVLYALLARIAGRVAATLSCLTLMLVFAFAQLEDVGSYNFLAPYSHEVVHGLVLGTLALWLLALYVDRGSARFLFASGLATGVAALTDGQVFLSGLLAVAAGIAVTLWLERGAAPRRVAHVALFVGGVALPILAAFSLLQAALPVPEALAGTFGSVRWLLRREIVLERLYRWQMGTLDLPGSLLALAAWCGWYLAALAPPALLGLALRKRSPIAATAAIGLFAGAVAAIVTQGPRIPWGSAFRPLPVVVGLVVIASIVAIVRSPRTLQACRTHVIRLSFALFALLLLSKILFNVRVMDYGFALAVPATAVFVTALFVWLPRALARRQVNPWFLQAAAGALLVGAVSASVTATGRYVHLKRIEVGSGRDSFLADGRGRAVNMTLDFIAKRAQPGDTLAVMPEGAILNYLARAPNPTPYPVLAPPEVALYDEQRMLEAFRRTPPDRIVFVHADSSIHGVRFFGQDYGTSIRAWVEQNYKTAAIIGARPFEDDRFGIQILERLPTTARLASK